MHATVSQASGARHLIAALITSFTREGEFDRSSMVKLVRHLHAGGVREYFALGSTGEAPLLDEPERQAVIEAVREAAPDGTLYAGISGTGHRHAIRNARAAAKAGADVVVLMSPFFIALDQSQLVAYCTAVAEASPRPLMIYHHLRMPTPVAPATAARLALHPNIIGIKDTSGGDHDRCAEILALTHGRPFLFLQGVEKLVSSTLSAGGHGCVVAQACIAPRLFRALFDTWERGDTAAARALQERIDALWGIFLKPEVRRSFSHFLHTLKRPLQQRGVIAAATDAVPGAMIEPDYEHLIDTFMADKLAGESCA